MSLEPKKTGADVSKSERIPPKEVHVRDMVRHLFWGTIDGHNMLNDFFGQQALAVLKIGNAPISEVAELIPSMYQETYRVENKHIGNLFRDEVMRMGVELGNDILKKVKDGSNFSVTADEYLLQTWCRVYGFIIADESKKVDCVDLQPIYEITEEILKEVLSRDGEQLRIISSIMNVMNFSDSGELQQTKWRELLDDERTAIFAFKYFMKTNPKDQTLPTILGKIMDRELSGTIGPSKGSWSCIGNLMKVSEKGEKVLADVFSNVSNENIPKLTDIVTRSYKNYLPYVPKIIQSLL